MHSYAFLHSKAWMKYPNLANILQDDPCTPKYNNISNNCFSTSTTSLINQPASTIANWGSYAAKNGHCSAEKLEAARSRIISARRR